MEVLRLYDSIHGFEFISELAVKMSDKLEARCKPYFENKLLVTASFMDPRYKSLKFFKD